MTTSSKLTSIGFNLADEWISAIMLAGLPDDFKPFIMSLEANSNSPTSEEIKFKLLDSVGEKNGQSGSAFFGKRNDKKKGFSKGKQKGKRKCFICKSTAHLAKFFDKRADSKEGGHSKESGNSANCTFTVFDCALQNNLNDFGNSTNYAFTIFDHVMKDESSQQNEHALAAHHCAQQNDWFEDSGASNHMTPHESILALRNASPEK